METNTTEDDMPAAKSRIVPGIWLGLLLIGIISGLIFLRPQLSALLASANSKNDCSPPILSIGANQFRIKTIQPASDGSLVVPANKPDTAYWVEGTDINLVFALSPTSGNLALEKSIQSGETVSIIWADCNTETYNLSSPQSGAPEMASLTDQSISEITIFVPTSNGSAGFVVKGELAEKTITAFDTPNLAEPQAEISLLEVSTSADGKTIQISLSISNTGDAAFSLSAADIALTDENGAVLSLSTSDPGLPQAIQPGDTKTILLTFPRPVSPTVTLKIFSVEFVIEGY